MEVMAGLSARSRRRGEMRIYRREERGVEASDRGPPIASTPRE
ncbi:MAG: hypothetical protein KatS3mg111_4358 [Pirellulaceae bacterium]|nr:MAG: hypothetical protein KatS3mg111_4358 [Pirellulaceae bacterium]